MVASPLRVVFFGTPNFAVPTIERLTKSRHQIVTVVTQPDRPRGRGQRSTFSPIKEFGVRNGLVVVQPERLSDPSVRASLEVARPDLGIVVAYGKILPKTLLSVPRLGMLNVHASLLPRYRGAAPVHRAIIAGEAETGITIMRVVPELDAGPVLAMRSRPIGEQETSDVVEHDLAELGAMLLIETVDRLLESGVTEIPQDDARATYAPRLSKNEGVVDWARDAKTIHNLIRGLHPWPRAQTTLHGNPLIIHQSRVVTSLNPSPGTVTEARGDTLRVACGEGELDILQLQPAGRRLLTAREFLAGYRLHVGDRLGG